MNEINSLDNNLVKDTCALHHTKYRYQAGHFIAEGIRVIETLLAAKMSLVTLFKISSAARTHQFDVPENKQILVTDIIMKKMSLAVTPSGFLAVFRIPPNPPLSLITEAQNGLVLANITDPGNMGTLIRSAAAMNVTSIIVVEGTDPWHPKVVQASAGTIGMTRVAQYDWQTTSNALKGSLCGMVVTGGQDPKQLDARKKRFLVIGNEAHGLPADWLADCDEQLTIAMPGHTESLNAAVAGSLALYLLNVNHQ